MRDTGEVTRAISRAMMNETASHATSTSTVASAVASTVASTSKTAVGTARRKMTRRPSSSSSPSPKWLLSLALLQLQIFYRHHFYCVAFQIPTSYHCYHCYHPHHHSLSRGIGLGLGSGMGLGMGSSRIKQQQLQQHYYYCYHGSIFKDTERRNAGQGRGEGRRQGRGEGLPLPPQRYFHRALYSAISSSSPSPNEDHNEQMSSPSSSSSLQLSITEQQQHQQHQQQQQHKRQITTTQKSIFAILTATTLNLLGFTMTSPLTPTIGTHFSLPTGASFGSLTSAYPLGMLFGLLAWPRLSDNSSIGRKKIMAISLLGSAFGLGLQCVCIWKLFSLRLFLIGRVLTGVFSGCGPVAKAYLADIGDADGRVNANGNANGNAKANTNVNVNVNVKANVDTKSDKGSDKGRGGNLAKYLAWRDAASTLAYILGPVAGGILFELFRSKTATTLTSTSNAAAAAAASSAAQSQALYSAYILGPVAGGILFELFRSKTATTLTSNAAAAASSAAQSQALGYVIGVSALGSLLAAALILFFVEDRKFTPRKSTNTSTNTISNDNSEEQAGKSKSEGQGQGQDTQIEDTYEIVACPLGMKLWTGVATVCVISFLYHVADSTFFAFFPALLQNQLQLNPKQIGLVFTMLSSITFCFSVTSMSSRLISKIGVVNTCALGLSAVGAGLVALSAASSHAVAASMSTSMSTLTIVGGGTTMMPLLVVGAAALYFCGVPLYGPTIPTMLLQCVPPYQRGTVMGIDGIINTIARIGSPIIMGDIYRRVGASMAFGVAGLAVFCSSTIAIVRRLMVLRDQKKLASLS
eukprot:CAMPEP_0203683862 /NCGR_PEP_ID=MMETSP0090-20130426/47737_1 /ASSEMBLY_ACC=CAM_ASM_001088 /TAXON_ID=426623 /ORGANISM="Chaetoceros affinis, Strain CCMP159" /LENGTH=808 /DNA_ID=CAMNT_0050553019 /DNA_START=198 /DNA_END=2625 /DNA_ORIENTATION=-